MSDDARLIRARRLGGQRHPLAALPPRLPRTRRWEADNRACSARPHAAAGGGHGCGRSGGGQWRCGDDDGVVV